MRETKLSRVAAIQLYLGVTCRINRRGVNELLSWNAEASNPHGAQLFCGLATPAGIKMMGLKTCPAR